MDKEYSQAGQDLFVLNLIPTMYATDLRTFVDIGCYLPRGLNNTLLLEENGWFGLSLDILDFHKEWESRKSTFIQADALTTDYTSLFRQITGSASKVIDYLNVDIEGEGNRFAALMKVFESEWDFKIITIEHDSYRGYEKTEAEPQRYFLYERGYELVCKNVHLTGNPFEDWWVNPKYISQDKYQHLICENADYMEIINKLK